MKKLFYGLLMVPVLAGGCVRNIVTTPPVRCASLIPDGWINPVQGAEIPTSEDWRDWAAGFVEQGGQLSKANGRTADAIGIMTRCEALVNESRR